MRPYTEEVLKRTTQIYVGATSTIWLGLVSPVFFFWQRILSQAPCLSQYNCLAFLDVSAQRIGVPSSRSFWTLVAANAASAVGRICSGFTAERLGVFNVFIVFSFIAAIMSYAWP